MVTKLMVNSWKDGRIKLDGVSFHIDVGVIAHVTEIPNEGLNFFRDKKVSMNVVKDFAKNTKEKKELVKIETYYEMDLIKKLWTYVLRVVIAYITLEMRFDRVRTDHFVLLKHFWYEAKISILFYLFSSTNKNILRYKKKPNASPALHEGLLMFLFEYFKSQSRSKSLPPIEDPSEETKSSNFSSNKEDNLSSSSKRRREIFNLRGRKVRVQKRGIPPLLGF